MSHDKTRIMPRAGAAAAAAGRTPGKRVGDKIVFHCSNGHKLVVPAHYAGKRGRCDRPGCGVQVVIPVVDAAAEAEVELPAIEPPAIEIPQPPAELPVPEVPGLEEAEPEASPAEAASPWNFIATGETAPPVAVDIAADLLAGGNDVRHVPAPMPSRPADEHPTSWLIARLWAEREHGGIVELHLVGGGVILPEWYESRWSRGSHGLFASQAADGSITLTAVAWDTIQKVVVRQVQGLPDGMFDDQ